MNIPVRDESWIDNVFNSVEEMYDGGISKMYGIHQGMGNPADKCQNDPEFVFKKFQESEPLDFSSIAGNLSSIAFNDAETDANGTKVTDLRSAMFVPPIIANKVFELQNLTHGAEMACQIINLVCIETPGDADDAPSTFSVDEEYHTLITWLYYFKGMVLVHLDPVFDSSDLVAASKDIHSCVFGPILPPPGTATFCSLVNPASSHAPE